MNEIAYEAWARMFRRLSARQEELDEQREMLVAFPARIKAMLSVQFDELSRECETGAYEKEWWDACLDTFIGSLEDNIARGKRAAAIANCWGKS